MTNILSILETAPALIAAQNQKVLEAEHALQLAEHHLKVAKAAATIRHRDWLTLHERRKRTQAHFAALFHEVDALLMPVVPVPAIPHDHSDPFPARTIVVNGTTVAYNHLFDRIAPATFAHLPATVVPAGRTRDGLPVGMQIVGPYLEDRTTVDLARRIAEVLGGFVPPPGLESE